MLPDIPLDTSGLLERWSNGEEDALAELTPLVYKELRRIASLHLAGERHAQSLNTTALTHEVWLRLANVKNARGQHRGQFFALCAGLTRRILVDHARARLRLCHGGGRQHIPIDESLLVSEERSPALVALDDALHTLAAMAPRKARVVELRFFGGLTTEEVAEVLKISPESVKRDWRLAKVWLMRELTPKEMA